MSPIFSAMRKVLIIAMVVIYMIFVNPTASQLTPALQPTPKAALGDLKCETEPCQSSFNSSATNQVLESGQKLMREKRSTGVRHMARTLVTTANICLELVDQFKDNLVMYLLSTTWSRANLEESPKICNTGVHCYTESSTVYQKEPYLPPVPLPIHPRVFDDELKKCYLLLQHYHLAVEHLSLDMVLFSSPYQQQVSNVLINMEMVMFYLKDYILAKGLEPYNLTTMGLMVAVYRRENIFSERAKRDFVFLRDTRTGIQYIKDTFTTFL